MLLVKHLWKLTRTCSYLRRSYSNVVRSLSLCIIAYLFHVWRSFFMSLCLPIKYVFIALHVYVFHVVVVSMVLARMFFIYLLIHWVVRLFFMSLIVYLCIYLIHCVFTFVFMFFRFSFVISFFRSLSMLYVIDFCMYVCLCIYTSLYWRTMFRSHVLSACASFVRSLSVNSTCPYLYTSYNPSLLLTFCRRAVVTRVMTI